jgi:hypothetical protein
MEEQFIEIKCGECGKTFMGPKPEFCCNGTDCGCRGLPIYPDSVFCESCLEKHGFFKNVKVL